MKLPDRILLSRTDRIGDVLLCFPVAAFLKSIKPGIFIGFLGTVYTRELIEHCGYIDRFEDREDFLHSSENPGYDAIVHLYPDARVARKAAALRIPIRVGIRNKLRLWPSFTHSILLSRKRSQLHEAELNLQLLRVFDTGTLPGLSDIRHMKLLNLPAVPVQRAAPRVVIHPFSGGSAPEWPLQRYAELVRLLRPRNFDISVSGAVGEKEKVNTWLSDEKLQVHNICGQYSLGGFIHRLQQSDILVASSTGPLHIAAAMGKVAIGIYSPMRPVFARRWGPAGPFSRALSAGKACGRCSRNPQQCICIATVDAQAVFCEIKNLLAEKYEKEDYAAG